MKKHLLICLMLISVAGSNPLSAQARLDSLLPVRGFCISAPRSAELADFLHFISNELIPRKVNTLILRVDFNYQYRSRPELKDPNGLSQAEVKQLVAACKAGGIRLIPQINMLGHQSWAGQLHNLLRVYPQFDETPYVKMPQQYKWPNADSLYCKSYCPLHPDVHGVLFPMIDELMDVFEADAFHAGMDEVFYIGTDGCPRCKQKDKAVLFAGEVSKIRNHLAKQNRQLWIWGDRLIDGTGTGIGMWEGSANGTYPAIDLIPKDVMICDWHYERADKTAVYFAMKGLSVATCPWRNPALATRQLEDMLRYRKDATAQLKPRFQGMIQTVWSGAGGFLKEFYEQNSGDPQAQTAANCFRSLFAAIAVLENE